MIGLLHEDIWKVVAAVSSDTTALAATCARLRRIVHDRYVDIIGAAGGDYIQFSYRNWAITVRNWHIHGEYDVAIYFPDTGREYNFDVERCIGCDSAHISLEPIKAPFSPEIVKIAVGMTQMRTLWKIQIQK